MIETLDSVDELAKRIWITKGARFAAHRRLAAMHAWSTAAIAILSAYLLIATIVISSSAVMLSEHQRDLLDLGVTGVALLVLVLSLLEGGRNYLVRAERLHDCAVELGALEQRVILAGHNPEPHQRLAASSVLSEEYHRLLTRCRENHDPLDNQCFRCDHAVVFPCSRWTLLKARGTLMWRSRGPFALAIILPPVALGLWLV
jgi:hypothetical protein